MDYFSLCLDGLCLGIQSVLHIYFTSRLTGRKQTLRHTVVYFLLLCVLELLFRSLGLGGVLPIGAGVLTLYAMSRFALGNRHPVSWAAAILAFYISQLAFGIINSVEAMLFPRLIGAAVLYPLLFAALAAFAVICACCYKAVLRLFSFTEDSPMSHLGLLLLPGLFFFAAELYILHTSYSTVASSLLPEDVGMHSALLFLQLMGLAALFCTLYVYRHLCRSLQAQTAWQSLAQAARAQKIYIAEAQTRYEQTKAFRHDIKNHLSVLDGLLKRGKTDESMAYLKKLEAISDALSFPYQTGNPVVDILLGEKLGLAKEITAEVALALPRPCAIDDCDLCVIFANALDNAISACLSGGGARAIRVTGRRQGDFYLLAFENTCPDGPLPPAGTGLSNIRSAAEKYRGAVLTEKDGRRFSLNVLLNIS